MGLRSWYCLGVAFSINTNRTGPSVGRPRTAVLDGEVGSSKGQSYYTPKGSDLKIPIGDKLAAALAVLAKGPDTSYETAAAAAGYKANGKGKCGPALSAGIRALCAKVADAA